MQYKTLVVNSRKDAMFTGPTLINGDTINNARAIATRGGLAIAGDVAALIIEVAVS